jgi:GT2 family glycosyltransferase
MPAPELTLVVASHARHLRLRWLLNALEDQTLDRSRWELVVVHDNPDDDPTEGLLREHPLAHAGVLRHHHLEVGTGSPARQRNVGWRDAQAPLVAFTDDDCRPDPHWLERMLEAAQAAPDAIVQGATTPDPHEALVLLAPRVRTLRVVPPVREAPTCNILYPRAALEAVDGFDERFPGPAGEDTDLAERVRAQTGADLVPVPDAMIHHAVDAYSVLGWAKLLWKWQHLPFVVRRHPHLREGGAFRIFWKHSHWRLLLALLGLGAAPRFRPAALLAVPYLRHAALVHGRRPSGVARALCELPSRAFGDAVEIAAVTKGSITYRTVLL